MFAHFFAPDFMPNPVTEFPEERRRLSQIPLVLSTFAN
jgi:hypothetical protein